MEYIHYINGTWLPTDKASISVFDLSVLRGFGIFDYLRTYGRKPFILSQHLDRLFRSAKYINLTVPKTKDELTAIVAKGIEKNKQAQELDVRIVVTGGVGPNSITPGNPTLLILFAEASDYPKTYYTKGVRVITETMVRQLPQAKTINYITAIPALIRARAKGAVEAIYVGADQTMYEGTTSNFFAVIDGLLVTPKEDVLLGITRMLVIKLAKKCGVPVYERKVSFAEFPKFSEVFITASNKEIMPVTTINDTQVGNGSVGPVTQRLREAYEELKTSST